MGIKDISLGRYIHNDSFIHRLDPRTKLISMIFLMSGFFIENSLYIFSCIILLALIVVRVSGIGMVYFSKSILPFKWLVLFTVALNVIFTGGHIVFAMPLPYGGITYEGLVLGAVNGARIVLVVICASILTLTTEPVMLMESISRVFKKLPGPFRRHNEILFAMLISLRFIPILFDEALKIKKSLISRGLNPDSGFRRKIKAIPFFVLPLFISAARKAEVLAVAMDSRLFVPGGERTSIYEPRMEMRDWIVISFSVLLFIILAV